MLSLARMESEFRQARSGTSKEPYARSFVTLGSLAAEDLVLNTTTNMLALARERPTAGSNLDQLLRCLRKNSI